MAYKGYSVVIGDVNGHFTEVFGKLAALHAKQNFAFAIIAGELFGAGGDNTQLNDLLDDKIAVPLPTYFALGKTALPQEVITKLETSQGELCTNLSILGRRVSIKTSEGFKIIAVGGQYVASYDAATTPYEPSYSTLDTEAVTKGLNEIGADILITSDWPANIQAGAKEYTGTPPQGVRAISDLCTTVKPRYHFSTSSNFYEREPFFHHTPPPRPITRFISLAPYGNPVKEKWIYAFSLEPSANPPQHLPQGTTATPFVQPRKRKLDNEENGGNNFPYSNGNANGGAHYERDNGRRKRGKFNAPPKPDQCFFCLSNPACETHMIASIGSDVYLTTSKGPLTKSDTYPDLGFPGHVLLIPLVHAPTMSAIADPQARQNTVNEMQKYRSALQDMLITKSKDDTGRAKLGAVTWEISRDSGIHLHWQFLPVPVDMIQRGLVEASFDVEAENNNHPKFEKQLKAMEEVESADFFKVMIWSESLRKEMVMPLDGSFRFDLQFGRRVMGKLLGLEKRTHWKDALQEREEEEADAEKLKEAFKAFDFSLEDE